MNNLYQEAQRDDWHGQIVAKELMCILKFKTAVKATSKDMQTMDTLQAILNSPENIAEVDRQMTNLLLYGTTHPEHYKEFQAD